jgi:hypothetical protein
MTDTCAHIREVLCSFADRLERLAFAIPAPNVHTPQLVELAIAMRAAAPAAQPPLTDGQIYGMTLRDHFAAKAMQGLLAAQVHGFNDRPAKGPFASMAYEMADAMLKAKEQ